MAGRSSRRPSEPVPPGLFDRIDQAAERRARARGASAPTPAPAAGAPADSPGQDQGEGEGERVWSVTGLTRELAGRLAGLGRLAVEGEVSGLRTPASGHLYFDLKDEGAKLSVVVWRSQVRRAVGFRLEEGAQVVVHGKLDVYAPRGTYSLIAERVERRGLGALLARLEELKAELKSRGWFDRRRPLPAMPRVVGLVTSRDGAALRDFLRTRSKRWPLYPVRLCHAAVQGAGAAAEIAEAIDALDASGVDVIVVTRGGGALEDLWAFNELPVAEAIWRASVPVVSAVGHESDTGLSDLVADVRAHTPTDAAQTVIPDRGALVDRLRRAEGWLADAIDGQLEERAARLERATRSRVLRSPDWILVDRARELRRGLDALRRALRRRLDHGARRVEVLHGTLARRSPAALVESRDRRLDRSGAALRAAAEAGLAGRTARIELAAARLEAVSPLKVLARGYSTTRVAGAAELLVDARDARVGDELETRLARGRLRSRVVGADPPVHAEGADAEGADAGAGPERGA